MARKPRILFLTAGGPCRALMAEGFARYLAGSMVEVEAVAASDTGPSSYCTWAMNETGVDISTLTPGLIHAKDLSSYTHIVALSEDALELLPPDVQGLKVMQWEIPDPARVRAKPQDLIRAFRAVRNRIEKETRALLTELLDQVPS